MASGIYFIRSIASGKMYIGSAVNVTRRLTAHRCALVRGDHPNPRLSGAFAKVGSWDGFESGILETCPADQLLVREQHWVDTLKPNYNIRILVHTNAGNEPSPEARQKMSAARMAHLDKPGVRENIGDQARARWADPEMRDRTTKAISDGWTDEQRAAARERGVVDGAARLVQGREIRWSNLEARALQGAAMKAARAKKARTPEDIADLVTSANPAWVMTDLTGTGSKDEVVIFCDKHQTKHTVSVNMLISRKQGCRACGHERSSLKQKGIVKPSAVARWDREGRKTEAELKAWKRDYDREYRLRQKTPT